MLTTSLLSAVLVGSAFAVPQPQQVRFSAPPPAFKAIADDFAHLKQDVKGAWNKVHKSVDTWAEQGVRKFDEVEHEGLKCKSQPSCQFGIEFQLTLPSSSRR